MFNKIWQWLSAGLGLIVGILFIKNKMQESEIEKKDLQLNIKDEQLDAKQSEIDTKEKEHQNEIDIKEFEGKVAKEETKIIKKRSSRDDQLTKKVYEVEDGKEYKVKL